MRPLLLASALSAVLLGSCFSPGDGQAPPLDRLYFPTGVVLDPVLEDGAARFLYVASSDFDLQYRSSALTSFDLNALAKLLPTSCNTDADCESDAVCDNYVNSTSGLEANSKTPGQSFFCVDPNAPSPCGALGEHSPAEQLLNPGRCGYVDPVASHLVRDSVGIGAFATDVIARERLTPGAGDYKARLFLPVRGDATLHWIDVDKDGTLKCGRENTSDSSCDDRHRVGDAKGESSNQQLQPSEPFAIDATKDGKYIAVTNQTSGSVSLFVNDFESPCGPSNSASCAPPTLEHVLTGLPTAPVGIVALPPPPLPVASYDPGFLVVYRDAPRVDLLRVHKDEPPAGANATSYSPYTLWLSAVASINANSIGSDSRGIVIDDTRRQAEYAACQAQAGCRDPATDADLARCQATAGFVACIQLVHQPSVFVSNRAPSSILVGALTPDRSYLSGTNELPAFTDSVALTAGPSRIVLGSVKVPGTAHPDERGTYDLERRVFIVCFDSRRIFVYDPERHVIESIITTGRGPYAFAIDEARGLGYVAHFTDSYLGVISLDQRFPQNYAAIIASVGVPSPPRSSK